MNFVWTDDTITRLRALWHTGATASTIGRVLGTTRNAVLGKVHRLRARGLYLPARPLSGGGDGSGEQRPEEPASGQRRASARPRFGPVSLFDARRGQCRFITTPPGTPVAELRFCGQRAVPGTSWCVEHRKHVFSGKIVTQLVPNRRGSRSVVRTAAE